MRTKFQFFLLLSAMALCGRSAWAQYSGGAGDGYVSSRSDDILYEGSVPVVTAGELPDVVHDLTINNSGGVTLSKNITVNGTLSVLNGDFNLNGYVITLGEFASLQETPGNIIIGGGGTITVTRTLNDLSAGQNVGNLGLTIKTAVPLGMTTVGRGNQPQLLTPANFSSKRFFDVLPTNNGNLDALVIFRYDEAELEDIPEEDLALFISHDAPALAQAGAKNSNHIAADPTWEFLGGTTNAASNSISKGGVPNFSRLTIGRGFVFLADSLVRIDGNETSAGDIHCNGKIAFGKGEPGVHTGNLTALGNIAIKRNNAIIGDVFAGGDLELEGNASISGEAQGAVPMTPLILPDFSFSAGNTDIVVPRYGTLNLPPGAYDEVVVKEKGRLFLSSGDYFIDELETEDGAVLSLDVAAGPVNVNVVCELEFDDEVEVEITPSGQAATNQVNFVTLQKGCVEIGECALILGWIYAPRAELHFGEDCRFKGGAVAKAITADEDVVFVPHSFSTHLTKPSPRARQAENSAQAAVTTYELEQNYPNPFNPATAIQFSVKEAGEVRLSIYDLQGREVRVLISARLEPGQHTRHWDGRDQSGRPVPSGAYFYKLRVNGFEQTRKMTLMK